MNLRFFYYYLPPHLRFVMRRLIYLPLDVFTFTNRRRRNIPPKGLSFVGSGDFESTGNRFVERLIAFTDLNEKSNVLDIGCGIGRIALPLTKIINVGNYDGFDIVSFGIKWCNKNISSNYPNFQFKLVDVKNTLYNSKGIDSSSFSFPYQNEYFSHAIAISLFTHLLPEETEHYLIECYRTLKSGGKLYATFFVIDDFNETTSKSKYVFPYQFNNYAYMNKNVQHANVLYKKKWLEEIFLKNNFIIEKYINGKWKDSNGLDLQDAYILVKKS